MDLAYYLDLEAYHAWATEKLLSLCMPLSDQALDAPREMGPGSLRATLKHILAAEQIWLDRWQGKPTSGLPATPDSISEILQLMRSLASQRRSWFTHAPNVFSDWVSYKSIAGVACENILGDLVQHVLNHGIHHRAQAVHFLKHQGVTIAGGLDYIFYRIASPTLPLPPEAAQSSRDWGLEVGNKTVPYEPPSIDVLLAYSQYGDWAMNSIFDQIDRLTDEQLDHDWGVGIGSIRRTLLHVYDAECFWQTNWDSPGSPFPRTPVSTTIPELKALWSDMSGRRMEILQNKSASELGNSVTVNFGGGPINFRFSESVIQLAVHGTVHRSQVSNMIRSTGQTPKALDYVLWVRERL